VGELLNARKKWAGFWGLGSKVQRFRGSGFKGSEVQGFWVTRVEGVKILVLDVLVCGNCSGEQLYGGEWLYGLGSGESRPGERLYGSEWLYWGFDWFY